MNRPEAATVRRTKTVRRPHSPRPKPPGSVCPRAVCPSLSEAVKIAGHMKLLPLFGIVTRQLKRGGDCPGRTFLWRVLRPSDLGGGRAVLLFFSVFHFYPSFRPAAVHDDAVRRLFCLFCRMPPEICRLPFSSRCFPRGAMRFFAAEFPVLPVHFARRPLDFTAGV